MNSSPSKMNINNLKSSDTNQSSSSNLHTISDSLNICIIQKIISYINHKEKTVLLADINNKQIHKLLQKSKIEDKESIVFALGLETGEISFWDASQNNRFKTLSAHKKCVRSIIQLSENTLVSAANDTFIIKWDLRTFSKIKEVKGHQEYIRCLLKLTDKSFVSGSYDHTIKLWDEELTCIKTIKGSTCFVVTLINIEENLWASGTGDGNIFFWDLIKLDSPLFLLQGHKFTTWCLEKISNKKIVSGSGDGTIRVWDYEKRKCKRILINGTTTIVGLSLISKSIIAAYCTDGVIRFWDMIESKIVSKIKAFEGMISCNSPLLIERLILVGSTSGGIKLYDLKVTREKENFPVKIFAEKGLIRSLVILK